MSVNGLRPYPAYRDSGVEWLGEVPEHWELGRASSRLHVRNRPIHPREISQSEIFHYSIPNVQQHGGGRREATSSVDSGKILVDRELLLVSKLNPRKGTIALAAPHPTLMTIASGEFVTMEPGACLGIFARYVYVSESVRLELSSRVNSATKSHQRCTPEDIAKLRVPWPPPSEQAAIARFLDHAERRIRRYIRAKERLIELLEERKRVLTHEAVTGRIDVRTGQPYPAYKDSGVEWLGKVPEHWEAKRIKTLARPGYKTFVDGDWIESPYITSDGIRLIQTGNIGIGEYREKGFRYISERTFDELGCTEFNPGDVLICRLGLPVARACLAPSLGKRMITSVDVCILRPRDDVSPAYLVYTMSSRRYLGWVASLVRGSTRDRVSRSMLGGFTVPVPPPSEQNRVADYLDEVVGDLKTTIRGTEQSIKLIRQYRTRLIADVVTGKLDVREAAVRLPETDPLAGDWDRADTIATESNLHSTENHIAREANA